ncbi:MAG TPA: hypothetical protein VFL04_05265 [Rectinemataceae bacterium]|nr:hypothetical protein [Rectinemataceae bacterium]
MIRIGLSSQALLMRSPAEILSAARSAGAEAREWADGVHVPHDDHKAAEQVMIETLRAGLTTASYSAIHLPEADGGSEARTESVFMAADILQAPNIRLFLGGHPTPRPDPSRRSRLVADARRLGDRAAKSGRTICLSMGSHTFLDRYAEALALTAEIGHPYVRLAWDALPGVNAEEASGALEEAGSSVCLVMARHVERDGIARGLAGEEAQWRRRLAAFKRTELDPKMGLFVFVGAMRDGASGAEGAQACLAEDISLLRRIADELEGGAHRKPGA